MNALQPVLRNKVPGLAMAGVLPSLHGLYWFCPASELDQAGQNCEGKTQPGAGTAGLAGIRRDV